MLATDAGAVQPARSVAAAFVPRESPALLRDILARILRRGEHLEGGMKLRHAYLALCFVGILLPYGQFLPWLMENGLDVRLFWSELFSTRIGGFFALDVFVSAAVAFVFFAAEARRRPVRGLWLAVVATLACGVSAGLPLFLALRERALEASARSG